MSRENEKDRGITLLEVVFAATAMVIVIGSGYSLVGAMSGSAGQLLKNFEGTRSSVEEARQIRRSLSRARVTSVSEDGSSLTYSVLVKGPGDSVLNADGTLNWGIADVSGGSATMEYVVQGELSEKECKTDLNLDGDKKDVFDVGRIVVTTDGGARIDVRGKPILTQKGVPDGDVDGDGQSDPIFQLLPNGIVQMRVFSARPEGGLTVHVSMIGAMTDPDAAYGTATATATATATGG